MRFLHLADLHFGKSLHGVSLLESCDQPVWAERFLALAEELRPDAVVIAGDVYDRGAPAPEAVELLSRFLTGLTDAGIPVLLIPGNHDSARRLAFGRELLSRQGLHIAGALTPPGKLDRVTLRDESGPVTFWLMPYVFPALVGDALNAETPRDYGGAIRALLAAQEIDFSQRNVLVAHQNVTASGAEVERGGSESMIGGVGQVDFSVFDGFDYVALGHIHAGYPVGRPEVRYAGSPLCYHFNEARQPVKGPLLVTLGAKGTPAETSVQVIPPLHPLKPWTGSRAEVQALAEAVEPGAYVSITLTDQRITPEISESLRGLLERRGCTLLELNSAFREQEGADAGLTTRAVQERSLPELFSDFYRAKQDGTELSEGEQSLLEYAAELLSGAGDEARDEVLAARLLARAREDEA